VCKLRYSIVSQRVDLLSGCRANWPVVTAVVPVLIARVDIAQLVPRGVLLVVTVVVLASASASIIYKGSQN
jgi:hypothetical protein